MANKTQFSAAHKQILMISARVLPFHILLRCVLKFVLSYIPSLAKLLCILLPPEDLTQMLMWGIQQPSPIACEQLFHVYIMVSFSQLLVSAPMTVSPFTLPLD